MLSLWSDNESVHTRLFTVITDKINALHYSYTVEESFYFIVLKVKIYNTFEP